MIHNKQLFWEHVDQPSVYGARKCLSFSLWSFITPTLIYTSYLYLSLYRFIINNNDTVLTCPSHSKTYRLLTSSLSLGGPVSRTTQSGRTRITLKNIIYSMWERLQNVYSQTKQTRLNPLSQTTWQPPPLSPVSYQPPPTEGYLCFLYVSSSSVKTSLSSQVGNLVSSSHSSVQYVFQCLVHSVFLERIMLFFNVYFTWTFPVRCPFQ